MALAPRWQQKTISRPRGCRKRPIGRHCGIVKRAACDTRSEKWCARSAGRKIRSAKNSAAIVVSRSEIPVQNLVQTTHSKSDPAVYVEHRIRQECGGGVILDRI